MRLKKRLPDTNETSVNLDNKSKYAQVYTG